MRTMACVGRRGGQEGELEVPELYDEHTYRISITLLLQKSQLNQKYRVALRQRHERDPFQLGTVVTSRASKVCKRAEQAATPKV